MFLLVWCFFPYGKKIKYLIKIILFNIYLFYSLLMYNLVYLLNISNKIFYLILLNLILILGRLRG